MIHFDPDMGYDGSSPRGPTGSRVSELGSSYSELVICCRLGSDEVPLMKSGQRNIYIYIFFSKH